MRADTLWKLLSKRNSRSISEKSSSCKTTNLAPLRAYYEDVAVDVREGSPTFGKYVAVELSDENKRQLFIPQGFAHGFHVLSDEAIFTYKVDNPYTPTHERGIRYDDPTVHVDWSITDPESINLSEKDTKAPLLKDAELNFKY